MHTLCLTGLQIDKVSEHLQSERFFWLDLESPTDTEVRDLSRLLNLHPLTVDDLLTFREHPKFEEYPGYAFMVVYGADLGDAQTEPHLHEVHMVVSSRCVVTIHHHELPELQTVRDRYANQQMRSEQMLIYRILDAITSTFFPVLTVIDDQIDAVEESVIDNPTQEQLREIFTLKRRLVAMRRVVAPLRDVFARNTERITDLPGMRHDERLYFRDLYDTMIRVADLVDAYRDLLSGSTDLYLSTVANRQGEINKQLTIIATIFLPLTFLTGFFGQNFSFLTGHVLNTTWSFLVLGLGLLVASVILLLILFRRRSWM